MQKTRKSKIISQTSEIVTNNDGTILQQTLTATRIVEKEPDYVKLYLSDIMKLSDLPKSSNSLLMELLRRSNYINEIIIVKSIRIEICQILNIAEITFRKNMEQFIAKGILTQKGQGVYKTNPFLFGKGSWENIRNIRLMVEYNEKGRFIIREEKTSQKSFDFFGQEETQPISGVEFKDKIGQEIWRIS